MVTGNVPFRGGTSLGVYIKHQLEQPVRPSLVNPILSSSVEQVILRALEKDPHKRLKTPRALAQTYSQALKVSAQSPTIPVLAPNMAEEAPTVVVRFSPKRLKSWLLYLPASTRKAIAAIAILVLLLTASLSFGFFVFGNGQISAVQAMRGASAQFDTSSGIKSPQFTPTPQNTPTVVTSKSTPPAIHKHKHKKGDG